MFSVIVAGALAVASTAARQDQPPPASRPPAPGQGPITPGPRTGTVTFTRIGDSTFLEMHVEGSADGRGVYKESGVLGWNEDRKVLAVRERLANGTDILSVGDWTSPIGIRWDTEPIRVQTQMLRLRRSYQILSAKSFSVTEDLSTNGGPFVRLGTGDFRKTS
jgi:hypothetical protein